MLTTPTSAATVIAVMPATGLRQMYTRKAAGGDSRTYHHGDLRRSLIDAALALVTHEQSWDFSLREVARRANVSHNAPYNHFADKRDLLAQVAIVGFATLRDRMGAAVAGAENVEAAFVKSACAYVRFGMENPAHYRLMFSSALATKSDGRPPAVLAAGAAAKAVLEGIIRRGARTGVFNVALNRKRDFQLAVLGAWSAVHGLTMLTLDGLTGVRGLATTRMAERVGRAAFFGLKR